MNEQATTETKETPQTARPLLTELDSINTHPHARGRRASDAHLIIKWWSFYAMMVWSVSMTVAALLVGSLLYLHVQENADMRAELAKAKKVELIPVYKKRCAPAAPPNN